MPTPPKLTKKQKKGLAFRQKKGKTEIEGGDVPISEDQDLLELETERDNTTVSKPKEKLKEDVQKDSGNKGKGKVDELDVKKKRKRDEEGVVETQEDETERPKERKKKKKKGEEPDKGRDAGKDLVAEAEGKNPETKSRFILFVGNLKYTTSKEAIVTHFAACDPPPTVRLLTPKSGTTAKSKGCAFLEFSHRNALQQALKLHQSELEGRKINVELTAGGGGKGDKRIVKVQERNRELANQRNKRLEKQHVANGEAPATVERPQRHSKTSGVDEEPLKNRTWTVGDLDDGKTHRGGRKHAKEDRASERKRPSKVWGTGVNAIPVG